MKTTTVGHELPGKDLAPADEEPSTPSSRARASGRVRLGREARLELASIKLAQIRGIHPALHQRDVRLDLAGGGPINFRRWTPENLDVFLSASPMWCIQRGPADDRHFWVVCGGHLLPALRQALPSSTSITVIVVDAKLNDRRWLQIAAVHAAAVADCTAAISPTYIQAVLNDAEGLGVPLFAEDCSRGMTGLVRLPDGVRPPTQGRARSKS